MDRSTEFAEQTRSGERGRSQDASPSLSLPSGNDNWRSRDPNRGRFPMHPWTSSRPPGTRPVTEEILPDMSVGNGIGVRARGEETLKGMRYLSLRTDSTQDSAPIARQCLQGTDRQPPTRNRGGTLSRGLLPGTLAFATGVARAAEKGTLPLRPSLPTLLGRGRGGGHRRLFLRPRHHRGGTATGSRGSGRGPNLGRTSRRFPRNLQGMQRPLNKSVIRSRAHLAQGRVEQSRREKARRRGKVRVT